MMMMMMMMMYVCIVTGFQLKCDLNMLPESWLNQMNNIMHNNNE